MNFQNKKNFITRFATNSTPCNSESRQDLYIQDTRVGFSVYTVNSTIVSEWCSQPFSNCPALTSYEDGSYISTHMEMHSCTQCAHIFSCIFQSAWKVVWSLELGCKTLAAHLDEDQMSDSIEVHFVVNPCYKDMTFGLWVRADWMDLKMIETAMTALMSYRLEETEKQANDVQL